MTVTTYATEKAALATTATQTMPATLSQVAATHSAEPPIKAVLKQAIVPPRTSPASDHSIISTYLSSTCSHANQSLNSLMLSTSVPIKIGNKIDNIDHEPHSNKNNRIRYTFGLNSRKKSTADDVSRRAASVKCSSANNYKSVGHAGVRSVSPNRVPTANESVMPSSDELHSNEPESDRQRAVVRKLAGKSVFVPNMNERGPRLAKQTTIDYYV